jgi:hypothetical protein
MRVVLHIGTDKTGSSAIQRHLRRNRDWFACKSVFIPLTGWGVGNGHFALLNDLQPGNLEKLSGELAAAEKAGFHTALLTWEGMCAYNARQIRVLRSAVSRYELVVIVYLREQADIIQSGHLQQVKSNRNIHSMKVFEQPSNPLQSVLSAFSRRFPKRNYLHLLNRWQRQLPSASIVVRIFSREKMLGGDVLSDFAGQLGIALDAGFVRLTTDINPSLDVESGLLVEEWQSRALPAEDIARLVDIALSRIQQMGPASKYFLSEQSVKSIRQYFHRSNLRMARKFMASDEPPFSDEKRCWRQEPFEQIEQRAQQLSPAVAEVDRIPTLTQQVKRDAISRGVELTSGWCPQEDWGVWSDGASSRIRFRVMRRKIELWQALRVIIQGRYVGDNRVTSVLINGIDFGEQSLIRGSEGLLLPTAALQSFEVIDITLKHSHPVARAQRQSGGDDRQIAFGLIKIGCMVVRD